MEAVYHIQSRSVDRGFVPAQHPLSVYMNQDPSQGVVPPWWTDLPPQASPEVHQGDSRVFQVDN